MTNKITSFAEYLEKYRDSVADPEGFWANIAESHYWQKKWDQVLDWYFEGKDAPHVNWFVNGKLNITENIFEIIIENLKVFYKTLIFYSIHNLI